MLEVELTLASSNYHTEMNPSDVGNNDRYVVQEILKVRTCNELHPDAQSTLHACLGPLIVHDAMFVMRNFNAWTCSSSSDSSMVRHAGDGQE